VGKLVTKRDWRFCTALGLLMNTRGLVEVIALNIGLTMVSVAMTSYFVWFVAACIACGGVGEGV
jgi:hypothetical protein